MFFPGETGLCSSRRDQLLLLSIWVVVIVRSDYDFELSRTERKLVLEVATHKKLEGILRHFFPSLRSARFGLVAWVCQTDLANR